VCVGFDKWEIEMNEPPLVSVFGCVPSRMDSGGGWTGRDWIGKGE